MPKYDEGKRDGENNEIVCNFQFMTLFFSAF